MSDNPTINPNSTLIDVCNKYVQVIRDLQQALKKVYLTDDPDEAHQIIKEVHAVYILKLKEIDGILQALKTELKIKQALGISITETISKLH